MTTAPAAYHDCVFINCPFSDDYRGLFQAVVFTVADCGFVPRSALEKSDSSETRIEKLYRIIGECRYGIHDLSATELDAVNGLPRFNMPFELGIFLGARQFGAREQRHKSCLVLDRERYRYQRFCSDLSGHDPKAHGGAPDGIVRCVRDWLRGERPDVRRPSGQRIWRRFERFQADLPVLADSLDLEADELEFNDLRTVIEDWLRANPP